MNHIKLYIGLDVHKDSVRCGIARAGRDQPEVYGKWGGSNLSVERGLRAAEINRRPKFRRDFVLVQGGIGWSLAS